MNDMSARLTSSQWGEKEDLRQVNGNLYLAMCDNAALARTYHRRMWLWIGVAVAENIMIWAWVL